LSNQKIEKSAAIFRFIAAAFFLALAGLSIAAYLRDQASRKRAAEFLHRFTVDERRPLESGSLDLAPSGDWTAAMAADAALTDATQGVRLAGLSPGERKLWLDAAANANEELAGAEPLLLDAIAARPGWGIYWSLLGQVEYLRLNRAQDPALVLQPARWREPLRQAAEALPGDDGTWSVLAGAYLETWQLLPEVQRPDWKHVLRRAMAAPNFVVRGLPLADELIGAPEALALVPNETGPLQAAFSVEMRRGNIEGAARLLPRRDRARRADRAALFAAVKRRAELGDRDGLLSACREWLQKNPPRELDEPEARAQLVQVLRLWPEDASGSWASDPRGAAIGFLLDRGRGDKEAKPLKAVAAALDAVPQAIRARLDLAAGDVAAAESVAHSSGAAGSLEWTSYLRELARWWLKRGNLAAARSAVGRISPAALGECESLLVRRDLARAMRDSAGLAAREKEMTSATGLSGPDAPGVAIPSRVWTTSGALSLCLDPERTASRSLVLTLHVPTPVDPQSAIRDPRFAVPSPIPTRTDLTPGSSRGSSPPPLQVERGTGGEVSSLVELGWDGVRSGARIVANGATLKVPLTGMAGRHVFFLRTLAGPKAEVAAAEIE